MVRVGCNHISVSINHGGDVIITILKCDNCYRMITFLTTIEQNPLKMKGWTLKKTAPGNLIHHYCKKCTKDYNSKH